MNPFRWLQPSSLFGLGKEAGYNALGNVLLICCGVVVSTLTTFLVGVGVVLLTLLLYWLSSAYRPTVIRGGILPRREHVVRSPRVRRACRWAAISIAFLSAAGVALGAWNTAQAKARAEREQREEIKRIGSLLDEELAQLEKANASLDRALQMLLEGFSSAALRIAIAIGDMPMEDPMVVRAVNDVRDRLDNIAGLFDSLADPHLQETLFTAKQRREMELASSLLAAAEGRYDNVSDILTEDKLIEFDQSAAAASEQAYMARKVKGDAERFGSKNLAKAIAHYQKAFAVKNDLDLALTISYVWLEHDPANTVAVEWWADEAERLAQTSTLERSKRAVVYAQLHAIRGLLGLLHGETSIAVRELEQAYGLLDGLAADQATLIMTLRRMTIAGNLGIAYLDEERYIDADWALSTAVGLAASLENVEPRLRPLIRWSVALAQGYKAEALYRRKEYGLSVSAYASALGLVKESMNSGDPRYDEMIHLRTLHGMAHAQSHRGDVEAIMKHAREARRMCDELSDENGQIARMRYSLDRLMERMGG